MSRGRDSLDVRAELKRLMDEGHGLIQAIIIDSNAHLPVLDCLLGWRATKRAPACSSSHWHLCERPKGHRGRCSCSCGATSSRGLLVCRVVDRDGNHVVECIGRAA